MGNKLKGILLSGAVLFGSGGLALAAGFFTNGVPVAGGSQYPTTLPLTGNETVPADTNLPSGLNPASEAITAAQIAGYASSTNGSGLRNVLIGGDFGTNLWQRGTSVGSIVGTLLYTADRWFAWSGTSTTVSVAQDTTAGEFPPAYGPYSAKISRTGTGVVQVCFAQEVESTSSYQFQGQTAELDLHAIAGAGFSAANSQLLLTVVYGVAADEGAQKLAWGFNTGGGGSSGWTGQANAVSQLVTIGTTMGRYVAVGAIPATAKELGVVICWTPVGASPTNDYVALDGIQLIRNNTLSALAGTVQPTTNVQASAFERRPQEVETGLQQRYFQAVAEPALGISVGLMGVASSTTVCALTQDLPVQMRVAPTVTFGGTALSTSTWRIQDSTTSTLGTPFLAAGAGQTVGALSLNATLTTATTAGFGCQLQGAAGGGSILASAEF